MHMTNILKSTLLVLAFTVTGFATSAQADSYIAVYANKNPPKIGLGCDISMERARTEAAFKCQKSGPRSPRAVQCRMVAGIRNGCLELAIGRKQRRGTCRHEDDEIHTDQVLSSDIVAVSCKYLRQDHANSLDCPAGVRNAWST